jgi:UDP-3-O-[3-hydroxymyristoyl] N-acetylglucosamine deacetylase
VEIVVTGPEVPLLDGGARELALAIAALSPGHSTPALTVVQEGTIHVGSSRYVFEHADGICVEVHVEFEGVGAESASWDGSAERFLSEIAPARTFGFRREAAELRASGRAAHVDPHAVIVLEDDGSVVAPGRPPGEGELARHKLLDLLGDFFLFAGPARGRLVATRPGHAATQRAIRQALEYGLLERQEA